MLEIKSRASLPAGASIADTVALDHIQREKGRLKVSSRGGRELRLFLERGKPLLNGEVLQASSGEYIQVVYGDEPVMTAHASDWQAFSKACYHFGNRHTRLQIGERWLRFVPDPVLQELAELLGLRVERHEAVFDPEPGAYTNNSSGPAHSQHGHSHNHNQSSSHNHIHSNDDHHHPAG